MLTLVIALHSDGFDNIILQDQTVYGGSSPARDTVALVVGTEILSPWQADVLDPEMGLAGYNPLTFLAADGSAILLKRPVDGILRVITAAVPVMADADILALAAGTGYATVDGHVYVRGIENDPTFDQALQPSSVLGEGNNTIPNVLAYTVNYHLWNTSLANSLARLNLRYLGLPYSQQAPLVNLYERIMLILLGCNELFRQQRYLDAAAVLEGGHKCLTTNGETPDAYAPLLFGFTSSNR